MGGPARGHRRRGLVVAPEHVRPRRARPGGADPADPRRHQQRPRVRRRHRSWSRPGSARSASAVDELTPPPPRPVPADERRARILTGAIEDLAGSRSIAQIRGRPRPAARRGDRRRLGRGVRPAPRRPAAVAAGDRGHVAVGVAGPARRRRDTGLIGASGSAPAPGIEGTLTIPLLAGQEVVGAALLGSSAGPAPAGRAADGRARRRPGRQDGKDGEASPRPGSGSTRRPAPPPSPSPGSPAPRSSATGSSRAGRAATRRRRRTRPAGSRASAASPRSSAGALTVDAVGELLVEHAVSELRAEFGLSYSARPPEPLVRPRPRPRLPGRARSSATPGCRRTSTARRAGRPDRQAGRDRDPGGVATRVSQPVRPARDDGDAEPRRVAAR
jgi:hypothetical protein